MDNMKPSQVIYLLSKLARTLDAEGRTEEATAIRIAIDAFAPLVTDKKLQMSVRHKPIPVSEYTGLTAIVQKRL